MKHVLVPFAALLLVGCIYYEEPGRTDPGVWLEGVARPEPIEPARLPYDPPAVPYQPPETTAAMRGLQASGVADYGAITGPEVGLSSVPGGSLGSYAAEEEWQDIYWDEDGVWFDDVYYPGASFSPGDYEDYDLSEDGYYVPGGVILGIGHLHHARCGHRVHPAGHLHRLTGAPRRYRGHRGHSRGPGGHRPGGRAPAGEQPGRRPAPPRDGPAASSPLPADPPARRTPDAQPIPPSRTKPSAPPRRTGPRTPPQPPPRRTGPRKP